MVFGPSPLSCDMQDLLRRAVKHVLTSWTALELAVDGGWGGRNTRQKRDDFMLNISELLAGKRNLKRSPANPDDVLWLADILAQWMLEQMCTNLEDGSDEEVAAALLELSSSIANNDRSVAEQLMQVRGADVSKCTGREEIQYADETDMTISMLGDLSLGPVPEHSEAAGDGENVVVPAPVRKEKVFVEPEIDEDGFETVVKKKKR